jgi:hypothetical protein
LNLNIIRRRYPDLNGYLQRAKDAVGEYSIIDINESKRTGKVVIKTGAEWFRDLSIP